MSLVVLGANVSPFVRKVRVFLAEKGLDYQLESVNPFSPPPSWREISPLGKIPALRDGDRVINDSSVICQYLERRHPTPPLYPSDDYDFARALWLEEFMDGGFVPLAGPNLFAALVLRPLMSQKPPDETVEIAARKLWDEQIAPFCDYLERSLGDAQFFVGDRLGIADLAVASPFLNARYAGFAPARARWPRLRSFLERTWERYSFAKLIAEEIPVYGRRAEHIRD
jgi:glutathione S-transferase